MEYKGPQQELFIVETDITTPAIIESPREGTLSLLWFTSDGNEVIIDGQTHIFNTNTIVCYTQFHQIKVVRLHGAQMMRFNRAFYCILDHDHEVGCKGMLFYGAAQLPIINIQSDQIEVLETVWKMLLIEMRAADNLQLEMLQMMLKRLLILFTRIYKQQANHTALDEPQHDTVRDFNFLVETHFKQKHHVADYAELLHKSPKTLSNLFKKIGDKTPLQYIHARIALEAKRLLGHTAQTASEIGYELGFNDLQSFSRFFKKNVGETPLNYRSNITSGKMEHLQGKNA